MDSLEMDVDFLSNEDAIQKFLTGKLKVIEARRQELQEQLERRKAILETTFEKSAQISGESATIERIWKKIVNNTFVIGVKISSNRDVGKINLTLNWKDKAPLTYSYTTSDVIFNSLYQVSAAKQSLGDQIVVITIPSVNFAQTLLLHIEGVLTYHENCQIALPTIILEAADVTNDANLVKKSSIIAGDKLSLLALIAASEETKLFLYLLHDANRNIEQMLEHNCYFGRIKPANKLFYAGEASDYFDGVVIQYSNGENNLHYLNIYSRSTEQMLSILHHLYRNISDILILPLCVEEDFRNQMSLFSKTEIQAKTEDLNNSLQREVRLVEEFLERFRIYCEHSDDTDKVDTRILESYKNFRLELNEQELKSDVLYSTLKHCTADGDSNELDQTLDDIDMY